MYCLSPSEDEQCPLDHLTRNERPSMNSMQKTREFLKRIGQPGGDAYGFPDSPKRFKDGGQYRFEVPGIQGPKVMKALLL